MKSEDWQERALRTQASVVLSVMSDQPMTQQEIRDAVNAKGHDFTDLHVGEGLMLLWKDGKVIDLKTGLWRKK